MEKIKTKEKMTSRTIYYIIAYSSLIVNIAYLGLWIYAFNSYANQKEQVAYFDRFIPVSNCILSTTLIVLSILSVIIFLKSKTLIHKWFFVPQLFFIGLFIWQYL